MPRKNTSDAVEPDPVQLNDRCIQILVGLEDQCNWRIEWGQPADPRAEIVGQLNTQRARDVRGSKGRPRARVDNHHLVQLRAELVR
jgi:hypothetical protein